MKNIPRINYWVAPAIVLNKERRDMEKVSRLICQYFDVPESSLMSRSRISGLNIPRQIAMYVMRNKLKYPYATISGYYDRDHATCLHAIKQVRNLMQFDMDYAEDVVRIMRKADKLLNKNQEL